MSNHVFDKRRWAAMTMFEQMGNIGSEVGRALSAKKRHDESAMRGALYRGLDLIDYTAELWAVQKSPRTKELLRARELFAESVLTKAVDPTLEQYFFQYALAARRNR
ncbi:hypothetical protein COY17_01470 [Candidatus Saccharibacteria bacterium CG_4_10_14_0_2_um_filter_52_9]|nr:MAG: hypothetical protein COY17_01470 [Candidatus Saccharibacteria bacterium CG_4_10_14_0_2_um_filter_52_9]